ncbi:oxidoreductase [Solemya velum gill symbiont]|nr:oxidoreductase [Solemya velum gill symbiont]
MNLEEALGNSCQATVKSSKRITSDNTDEIRELHLSIDEPAFRCMAGQNIGVLVPGPHPFGNEFHHRYYTIAGMHTEDAENVEIEILVRRCFYIDEVSGESYPGISSNYLCDAIPGEQITITGPYKAAFRVPADKGSNLLMIGTGTGIAPFRTLVKSIYDQHGDWQGKVRLFYGAKSGLDTLYMNDQNSDLTNYYDEATFKAYSAINPRPRMDASVALGNSLAENSAETWALMQEPNTYVYLAGLKKQVAVLDKVMSKVAGSEAAWQALRKQLAREGRWAELTFQ